MSVMKSGDASMSSEDHERRVIGKRLAKFDALDKALGRAIYVSDMVVPGMLHAKLVHNPHAHATIRSIDAEAEKALPGVRGVVTYADVPSHPVQPPRRRRLDGRVRAARQVRPGRHGPVCGRSGGGRGGRLRRHRRRGRLTHRSHV